MVQKFQYSHNSNSKDGFCTSPKRGKKRESRRSIIGIFGITTSLQQKKTVKILIEKAETTNTEIINDDKLLELAYDQNYRYPIGFYHENDLKGSRYYENTISTTPLKERGHTWFELHTMNKEEAKNWSNLSNENSSVNRNLVEENKTEKYFEFVRVNDVYENDVLLSRVHRSDYFIPLLDRLNTVNVWDRLTKNKTIGIYKGNVSLNDIKVFIEYLWDCGSIPYVESKIVETRISEKSDKYEYYIQSLLFGQGDWNTHDEISIYENTFSLDKKTKILTLVERKLIKEIQGKYNEGCCDWPPFEPPFKP